MTGPYRFLCEDCREIKRAAMKTRGEEDTDFLSAEEVEDFEMPAEEWEPGPVRIGEEDDEDFYGADDEWPARVVREKKEEA